MHLNHPKTIPSPSSVHGKTVFQETIPGAKNVGDLWSTAPATSDY